MPLHRFVAPTYLGGIPVTHDLINDPATNGDSGLPALADSGKKTGGVNDGTYFIAFGEDGTSSNGNRPHEALAQNTDFLDDAVSGELPVPTNTTPVVAGADISILTLSGDVFVGKQGTANSQAERDRLVSVLDATTRNEIITSAGTKVVCTQIRDGAAVSQVGVPASGFYNGPELVFSPAIPSGTNYTIVYARRGSLVSTVVDKTDLDALTRFSIRAAHEVPAESLRFIREAGRRVGGSVAALVATILETPGIGENLLGVANSLIVDIDPDNTAGPAGGGTFDVRFNRNAVAVTNFRVKEADASEEASVENPGARLNFADIATRGSGFTSLLVPFSSTSAAEGDRNLRLLDSDPDSEPVSILKRLNATPTITCGNGSTTFGDFNGVTALVDAVTYASSKGIGNYHIVLKRGNYTVDNLDLAAGTDDHIIIEGDTVGPPGASIYCAQTFGATSAGLTASGSRNLIEFRNIQFFTTSTGHLAVYLLNNLLKLEDCAFANATIRLDFSTQVVSSFSDVDFGSATLFMKRCSASFTGAATVNWSPIIHLAYRTGNPQTQNFIIEDCDLRCYTTPTSNGQTVLRVENVNIASPAILGDVLFNRCRIVLGTAPDTGGGNMAGNSSVLDLVPGTTTNMDFGGLEWRDCYVSISGANVHRPLLHARVSTGGGGSLASTTSQSRIKISGGRWEASPGSTSTPFYIGDSTYDTAGAILNTFEAENVHWGYTTLAANGGPLANLSVPSTAEWAAFFICAERVKMKDVTWISNTGDSGSGDLFIREVRDLHLDGVYLGMNNWVTGIAAGNPQFRVRIEADDFAQSSECVIDRLLLSGPSNIQATEALLIVVPNAGTAEYYPFTIQNSNISGNASANGEGIKLEAGDAGEQNGLHILNTRLANNAGAGFEYDGTTGTSDLEGLLIRDCLVDGNGIGIILSFGFPGTTLHSASIVGNTIRDNTGEGFNITGTSQWDNAFPGLTFHDNVLDNNNGGVSARQMVFNDSANAVGTFYGNKATGSPSGLLLMANGPSTDMRGTETGYNYDPGAGAVATIGNAVSEAVVADVRYHGALDEMLHNRLRYET